MIDKAVGLLFSLVSGLCHVLYGFPGGSSTVDKAKLSPRAKVIYTAVILLLLGGWIWFIIS